MAGNTKLIGFQAKGILLEKWGERVSVLLPEESINELRDACLKKLPVAPPKRPGDSDFGASRFSAEYEEEYGFAAITMGTEALNQFIGMLERQIDSYEHDNIDPELQHAKARTLRIWLEQAQEVLKKHEQYTTTDGEPGGEDEENSTS